MHLVTCFKNKSPTYFTFLNFYKNHWKVEHFYFIIGYTSDENKEYILKNYVNDQISIKNFENLDNNLIREPCIIKTNINCTFILYKTVDKQDTLARTWDVMKCKLMTFFYKHFLISNIISIDSDEFLYINDVSKLKDNHRFHYIEIMLKEIFEINDDLEWCLQSWCNIKYFGQKKTCQDCTSCKTFNFNHNNNIYNINKYMLSFKHSGKDLLFKESACELVKDKTIDIDEAKERGICFHLLGFTKSQLVSSKEKRWNNKWDTFFSQNEKLREVYGTIVCNLLKDYIDSRDLPTIIDTTDNVI